MKAEMEDEPALAKTARCQRRKEEGRQGEELRTHHSQSVQTRASPLQTCPPAAPTRSYRPCTPSRPCRFISSLRTPTKDTTHFSPAPLFSPSATSAAFS